MGSTATTNRGDTALVSEVLTGDRAAFDELYRRHAQSAWRVAQAVTRNADDAADAVSDAFTKVFTAMKAGRFSAEAPFRPYLLTTTRNSAIDQLRKNGRTMVADDATFDRYDDGESDSTAAALVGAADASFAAEAFRKLPERWRSVLWLTEVEGLKPAEAAEILGMTPNSTSQLAVRARAGLRERFLQAHLRELDGDDACAFTTDRLGAYVAGQVSARDLAKLDQHLADCDECFARKTELEEVGHSLRRIVVPIPLGLGAVAAAEWIAASSAAGVGAAGGILGFFKTDSVATKVAAGAAATSFALGVGAAVIVGGAGAGGGGNQLAAPPAQIVPAAPAAGLPAPSPAPAVDGFDGGVAGFDRPTTGASSPSTTARSRPGSVPATGAPGPTGPEVTTPATTPSTEPPAPAVPPTTGPPPTNPPPPTTAPPAADEPDIVISVGGNDGSGNTGNATVRLDRNDGVGAGGAFGDQSIGEPSEPPADRGLQVDLGGDENPLPTTLP